MGGDLPDRQGDGISVCRDLLFIHVLVSGMGKNEVTFSFFSD